MRFVALDLETTGLDTNNDTIIEIASVSFTLELVGEEFIIQNTEEHSQLINPERILEQEISMITGISNEMLIGKPTFEDIRDRVREFIGDAIIVGHNVLFDIAMLRSHGIDLEKNIVIDTFELSEIFSQDVESLNLGFLANRYQLINPEEEEHRALTDTKISIRLFTHYLKEVRLLDEQKYAIWEMLRERDKSHTLHTISKICHTNTESRLSVDEILHSLKRERVSIANTEKENQEISEPHTSLVDTQGNIAKEIQVIKDAFKHHSHVELITPGYKSAIWMETLMKNEGIGSMLKIETDRWCSLEYIEGIIESTESYSRKKLILILKIMFWITKTETGLLDELKYYGEERQLLEMFRSNTDESSIWQESYYNNLKKVPLLIGEIGSYESDTKSNRFPIIKDITLIEDIVRRKKSKHISFDTIIEQIGQLSGAGELQEYKIHMSDMIEIIRGIYESIPERPTGPLSSPPGAYGETYFVTQAMLWHRGHKWLVHASRTLASAWQSWQEKNQNPITREVVKIVKHLEKSIKILQEYHTYTDPNHNCIITIQNTKTELTLIPRHIQEYIQPLLLEATAYGNNIGYPQTRNFLIREYGYQEQDFVNIETQKYTNTKHLQYAQYHADRVPAGAVILTTSQKHARDIGQELRKLYGKNREILIQGLSGGKSKMLSIFKKNTHKTILIGLIDTWRDEYDLWPHASEIIITKLPFDPPTDPYFLGRTVGMSNNFSEYSEPIVTIRLNTLIERIISTGYSHIIYTSDSRLLDTEWGRRIHLELL